MPLRRPLSGDLYPVYRRWRKALLEPVVFCTLLPLFLSRRRGEIPPSPRSILVVALLKIGDTVTTLPTVDALRRRFPGARLAVWCRPETAPLLTGRAGVDAVFPGVGRAVLRQIRTERFDVALVCSFVPQHLIWARLARPRALVGYAYKWRGLFLDRAVAAPPQVGLAVRDYPVGARILHQVEVVHLLAEALGAVGPPAPPSLDIPPAARERAARLAGLLATDGAGPRVALHPWNDQPHYRWPDGRWAALARSLVDESGARLWIAGGARDAEAARALARRIDRPGAVAVAAGRFGVDETAALFSGLDLVVSVDTMATHLAAAVGTPVVALFGPGAPAVWRPLAADGVVLQNTRVCHGCRQNRCFRARHECMEGIGVDETLAACRDLLSRLPRQTVGAKGRRAAAGPTRP